MGITQPSIPLPAVFSKIAGLLKTYYSGKSTDLLHPSLPPGIVKYGEQWVQSKNISFKGHKDNIYIKGRFDIVVEFNDNTYGVIDFKTGNITDEKSTLYSRQLNAYSYALENPAQRAMSLTPVNKLGLLYFYPNDINQKSIEKLLYVSEIQWIEIDKNDRKFLDLLEQTLTILELDTPPAPDPGCIWCNYTIRMKELSP